MSRVRIGAWVALLLALAVFGGLRLRVGTDITKFMPDRVGSELATLSMALADSPFTRTMVFAVGAHSPAGARAGARELAAVLAAHPEIAWVRSALDEDQLRQLFELYFPRRHAFLSDRPEEEIPELLGEGALRERARALERRLASPAATFLERLVAEDPLGGFERIVARVRGGEGGGLRSEGGQLVSADGRHAVLFAATRASPFASGPQARLLADVDAAFAEIAGHLGDGLVLEASGINRFAVSAEKSIRGDVWLVAALSASGVAAVFALFVGSLRGFLLVSLPPVAGILFATACVLGLLGGLDGLTMAFGASLMGIAIDYSNHLLVHHGLDTAGAPPRRVARRLAPTLTLGALTTVASLAGWGLTAFPAFREMALFAGLGVLAALLVSLHLLPDLLPALPPLPARAGRVAEGLAGVYAALSRRPRALLAAPLVLGALALTALPSVQWSDDVARLTRIDPELVAEDARVRALVGRPDEGQFAVGLAEEPEAAAALADAMALRLEEAAAAGALEGTRSLHELLWSESLQRRNLEQLRRVPGLADRVERAFAAEGFRPEALAPFRAALSGPPPEPLTLAELRAAPLGDLLAPFVIPLPGGTAVVSYLRGLRDPQAVRAALADLPGVHLLDQRSFVVDVYREFRQATLRQVLVGAALVLLLLAMRYRAWRPAVAAFLPSLAVAALLLAGFALAGVEVNLLHVMSLIMVMGMGVDYGVFLVDSAGDSRQLGATLLSLLLSCLTTALVFGVLVVSSQPALRAIGATTGIGIVLSYLLAPLALLVLRPVREASP